MPPSTELPSGAPLARADVPAEAVARDPLQSIATQLSSPRADAGLLAALRRFNPLVDGRHNLFEVQQVLMKAGVDLPAGSPWQARWALVVHCLALARGAHHPGLETGARLAELGLSEARLRQLLEADAPLLADLLPTLARRLAAAGMALNWWPLTQLVLSADDDAADLAERAQTARQRIVQGYLREVAKPART